MKSSGFFPDMNDWFEVATFLRHLQEDRRAQEEEDPDWWLCAEDGSEYDLDPNVFSSEKEYNEARDEKEAEIHPFSPYLSADGVFLFSRAQDQIPVLEKEVQEHIAYSDSTILPPYRTF